ncbi:hypothetical protein B0T10DRAFT_581247 [Thelonectria olida]|uniref:Uncharacterized protein n=1 Tax=Thelonectria olida TaxID=1576542 RepID=A0A9P8VVI4_9HYPO|nr:hypothetical protein B0T10DRAFT_581247 [Thelonectria olida]
MNLFLLLLTLSGTSLATLTGFSGQKGIQQSDFAGISSKPLSLSVTCSSLETSCDGYCIPSGGKCCSYGDGSYCETGNYCTNGGCCDNGEICTGDATGCDNDRELCGSHCIPKGSVCCNNGSYCDSGETCTSDGFCSKGSDNSSDNKSDSSSDSATDTSVPQPTSTNGSDGNTLCARKSRGGSSDDTTDGGVDGNCDNDGAGSALAPNMAGMLLAIFMLMW